MRKCHYCEIGETTLRRLGFQDNIVWGPIEDSPNEISHATHSNSVSPKGNLLCITYGSEIGWVMTSRAVRPTIYVAHPLSGNFHRNMESAARWVKWLRRRSVWELSTLTGYFYKAKPIITAPWMGGAEMDSKTPGGREAILAECKEIVTLFDEVWAVSGLSDGVRVEGETAKTFRDLTYLGKKPPTSTQLLIIMKKREKYA